MAAVHHNYAGVLRSLGRLPEAMRAYQRALALSPDPDTRNNLALVMHEMGLPERAREELQQLLAAAPKMAAAWCNLGNVLRDCGEREAADAALVRALSIDEGCTAARYNRFATLYQPTQPAAARAAMKALLDVSPGHALARYQLLTTSLAVRPAAPAGEWVAEAEDEWQAGLEVLNAAGAPHLASSLQFMKAHWTPATRLFADSRGILAWALATSGEGAASAGSIIELGVRHGHSLRFIAEQTRREVHGFDSFEGLPAAWGTQDAGLYTTEGHLPPVPSNVTLHVGLFAETLPAFVASHPQSLRFANVDCDIYASTRDALTALSGIIVSGTVLVFDEYLGNPDWQQDEHRAFTEWCEAHGSEVTWLAFSPFTRQAVAQVRR